MTALRRCRVCLPSAIRCGPVGRSAGCRVGTRLATERIAPAARWQEHDRGSVGQRSRTLATRHRTSSSSDLPAAWVHEFSSPDQVVTTPDTSTVEHVTDIEDWKAFRQLRRLADHWYWRPGWRPDRRYMTWYLLSSTPTTTRTWERSSPGISGASSSMPGPCPIRWASPHGAGSCVRGQHHRRSGHPHWGCRP